MSPSHREQGDQEQEQEGAPLARVSPADQCALRTLLIRDRHRLELFCFLMIGDRVCARAALADTVLAAWDEIGSRDPRTPAHVWLYRLALRECSGFDPASAMSFGIGER